MRHGTPWTAAEDAILREHYARDWHAAAALMPYRSHGSIQQRALRLGETMRHRWTVAEDEMIRNNWGHVRTKEVAQLVGRSETATLYRAGKLGLGRGCPAGFEYFTRAMKRTGYDAIALRRILRAFGVRMAPMHAIGAGRKGAHRFVDPFDVDAAVAQWHATEAVDAAAKRRGICSVTLRSWLRDARHFGFAVPPKPPTKQHWRVPSDVIDAVVADRRGKENVSRAAARLGVARHALARWLVAAGVERPKMKLWLIQVGVADRVVAKRLVMGLAKTAGVRVVRRAA